MYGTGFFPAEKSELLRDRRDGLYLTGTSEVALAGLHMGEILDADALPLRYAAFSANFRREAGAAGRDTRGMFRVHQFNKVEMFSYVLPETSWDELERLLAIEERLAQALGLPYRVLNIAAGELSAAAAKRTTSRRGSRPRVATGRSHRRRTRPTTRPAASASAIAQAAAPIRPHAERHRRHRPVGAGDPGELRRRGTGGAAGVRRAGPGSAERVAPGRPGSDPERGRNDSSTAQPCPSAWRSRSVERSSQYVPLACVPASGSDPITEVSRRPSRG